MTFQLSRTTRVLAQTGLILLCGVVGRATAAPISFGPTPYSSFTDSPLNSGSFLYFHLEDFEDGLLNTPGATPTAGWVGIGPSPNTDSVDADDGAIDGSGAGGASFYSGGNNSLTIAFNAAALGGSLPTHAGIVWTDVGFSAPTSGFGSVSFSALDGMGIPLGSIGPFGLGDGLFNAGTAEDRFFGILNQGGISQITISMNNSSDWEVDHLQYGFQPQAVPEPSRLILWSIGFAGLFVARARRPRSVK